MAGDPGVSISERAGRDPLLRALRSMEELPAFLLLRSQGLSSLFRNVAIFQHFRSHGESLPHSGLSIRLDKQYDIKIVVGSVNVW